MWFVIGLIFIFAVSLIPGAQQKFEKAIQGVSGAITSGPVGTVKNAWIEVAVVGAAIGGVVFIAQIVATKKLGYDVAPAPAEAIHPAPPPTFGAQGGFSAGPGGVVVHQGVSAGSGGGRAPDVTVLDAPAPSRGKRPSRLERKAQRESLRADVAQSQAQAESARTSAAKSKAARRRGFDRQRRQEWRRAA